MQNRRVALILAYQPNSDMAQLVQEIKDTGFQIVVVDDGSSPEKEEVFRMAAKNAVILKHNENRGKGRALKTGLDYIYSKFSADCVVVTVDADGQHKPNGKSLQRSRKSCRLFSTWKQENEGRYSTAEQIR